jgi:histidinol-phosphatase (PHP family)
MPGVVFTEHAEFAGGVHAPPALDVTGYAQCLQRCRERFPDLRVLSGVELGEPHRHGRHVRALLGAAPFDRVLGSLHSLGTTGGYVPVSDRMRWSADDAVRAYLAEVTRMVETCDSFAVLAHIDYAIRYWSVSAGPYDPRTFEEEYRHALRVLARSGRALEVNTTVPLDASIVRWWHESGGEAITFGSDAHQPSVLARGFATATAMVAANGFRPGAHPLDFWVRES